MLWETMSGLTKQPEELIRIEQTSRNRWTVNYFKKNQPKAGEDKAPLAGNLTILGKSPLWK